MYVEEDREPEITLGVTDALYKLRNETDPERIRRLHSDITQNVDELAAIAYVRVIRVTRGVSVADALRELYIRALGGD